MGKKVPAILLSGDHKKVDEWRLEQSIIRTKERRPDLYEKWLLENPPKPEKKKRKR
jgi:tRNA (guanine37-N1)-methyltransferase